MFGTEVMPGRIDSSLRFIDVNLKTLYLETRKPSAIAVCFSCDELIASVCPGCTRRSESRPARAGRPITINESNEESSLPGITAVPNIPRHNAVASSNPTLPSYAFQVVCMLVAPIVV